MRIRNAAALTLMLSSLAGAPAVSAAPPACASTVDDCVNTLIAETAGLMAECGHVFPAAKDIFDAAFKHWPVLKLPIPGLARTLDENSSQRFEWRQSARQRLDALSAADQQTLCSSRLEMLTQPEASLLGDTLSLPPDALKKYSK